jgi:hypothetical protein
MGHQPENRKLDFLLAADPSPPTPTAPLYNPETVVFYAVGSKLLML